MANKIIAGIYHDEPKPRIVQFNKRRDSVRLESAFWRTLEGAAQARGLRLGRLVAELATGYDGRNFSSYLRVFCMAEAERAAARADLLVAGNSLVDALAACPAPGLLLNQGRVVLAINDAFSDWLGEGHPPLIEAQFNAFFQLRAVRGGQEVWQALADGRIGVARTQLVYLAPGRVSAVQARMLALHAGRRRQHYYLIWLATPGTRRMEAGVRPSVKPR